MRRRSSFAALALLSLAVQRAPCAAAAAEPALEELYGDWLDAVAAVATIDSGLMPRVDGQDRATWEARRAHGHALLGAALPRAAGTTAAQRRAVAAMRKGFAENADASDTDPRASATRCADRSSNDLDTLQRALYACFDEIGDQIVFDNDRMVRTSALQRLQEIARPGDRKRLFDAFQPLWRVVNGDDGPASPYRRMLEADVERRHRTGRDPVQDAASTLRVSPAELESWLMQVLTQWRRHLHGPAVEPWDYWYSNAAASRELSAAVPVGVVLSVSKRYYHDLGADLDALGVLHDLSVRPGKAPLAYTDQVRIGRHVAGTWRPAIPRVSANYERGGLFVVNELVHEDAHAVHEAALRVRPAFFALGDDLFVEAFADVPAWAVAQPDWQRKYLGRAVAAHSGLRELLSNVMLDVAWGLFEIRMTRTPAADPNLVWTDITARYLNILPHPELSWWALRVQLVRWPGYLVNYGAGAILTADIRARTRAAIGAFDAGNPHWYGWSAAHLLRFGTSRDTPTLLHDFLGRPVSPAALLSELRRLD